MTAQGRVVVESACVESPLSTFSPSNKPERQAERRGWNLLFSLSSFRKTTKRKSRKGNLLNERARPPFNVGRRERTDGKPLPLLPLPYSPPFSPMGKENERTCHRL